MGSVTHFRLRCMSSQKAHQDIQYTKTLGIYLKDNVNNMSKTIPIHLGLEAKLKVLWWGNSAGSWLAASHVSHKPLLFQSLACALEGIVIKPVTPVEDNCSATLCDKRAFNSPVVDTSFMLMCLHS